MRKVIVVAVVFLAIVSLAGIALAGDRHRHGDGNRQEQEQNQEQNQGQAQAQSNSLNIEGGGPQLPEHPMIFYPSAPFGNADGAPRWNDLTKEKAMPFPCDYSMVNFSIFQRNLSEKDRKILEKEEKYINEGYYASNSVENLKSLGRIPADFVPPVFCGHIGAGNPRGVEGRDYFILAEINLNAQKFDVQALMFKHLIARATLRRARGNAFSIKHGGTDPELRNGGWALGATAGAVDASKGAGQSVGIGGGVHRGWSKEQHRPDAYAVIYLIVNVPEEPCPPDDKIARCTLPGPANVNLRIDEAIGRISAYKKGGDVQDLRLSRDTLWIAIDRDRARGEQLRRIHEILASVNLELARKTSGQERDHYAKRARESAQKAGLRIIRTVDEY